MQIFDKMVQRDRPIQDVIKPYDPSDEEVRREWEGSPSRRQPPPVRGKRQALSERPTFGKRRKRK